MKLRVKDWREKRGLSLRDLADKAGISFSTIHRIEMEQTSPTVAVLERLASALQVDLVDFFPAKKRKRKR